LIPHNRQELPVLLASSNGPRYDGKHASTHDFDGLAGRRFLGKAFFKFVCLK
jgi:hypothetical protein